MGKKHKEKKTINKGSVVSGHTAVLGDLLQGRLKVMLRTKVWGLGSPEDLGDVCQPCPHCPGDIHNYGSLKAQGSHAVFEMCHE